MRKFTLFILSALICSASMFAESGTCGANLTWDLTNGVLTISGTGAMKDYAEYDTNAPWYLKGYNGNVKSVVINDGATHIGNYAFHKCKALTSVTIPNSVTSIGEGAFKNCSKLASLDIPSGVTGIGASAFCNCSVLAAVNIPNGVTSIEKSTFAGCSALTSIDIPSGVTSIGENAFSSCSALTAVTIPNGVTSIEKSTFYGCNALTSVTIPNSVTSIGASAFYSCYKLASIDIPSGVTSIGGSAFSGCSALTSVEIPSGVTSIGSSVFYGCKGLTSVTIPNTVTSIEYAAFESCKGLTSVTIPNSVTSLGKQAFQECTALTSVTIGDGVTSIEDFTFYKCSALTTAPIGKSVTNIGYYAFHSCEKLSEVNIPDGVTTIGNSAFYGCHLSAVTLPKSLTTLENSAFALNSVLKTIDVDPENPNFSSEDGVVYNKDKSVLVLCPSGKKDAFIIPNHVTAIGDYAFHYCASVKSMTIPSSVTEIGKYAFYYCNTLTSITCRAKTPPTADATCFTQMASFTLYVPESVLETYKNTVPWSKAQYFSGLPEFPISGTCGEKLTWELDENGVLTISGTGAMTDWSKASEVAWNKYLKYIETIVLEEGVTSIGNHAFENCDKVTEFVIPDYIESIGGSAFYSCDALESVTIGNGVKTIGSDVFYGCKSMKSVTMGNSVTNIGSGAFDGCSALKAVYISNLTAWCAIKFDTYPANPLHLAHNLYLNGELITDLVIPNDVYSVKNSAFFGGTCFTSLTFHENFYTIGWYSFEGCSNLESILFYRANPPEFGFRSFDDVDRATTILYVQEGSVEKFKNAEGWNEFENIEVLPAFSGTCGDNLTWDLSANVLTISGEGNMDDYYSFFYTAPWNLYRGSVHTIDIAEGVTSIGNYAFNGCSNVKSIVSHATVPPTCGDKCFEKVNKETVVVYVPKGKVAQYKGTSGWNEFSNIEVNPLGASGTCGAEGDNLKWTLNLEGLLSISGTGAMADNVDSWVPFRAEILSVAIAEGATSIGKEAFAECTNLTALTIPSSVTSIGNGAFLNCSSLPAIILPKGITSIKENTFSGCAKLTGLIFPNTLTEIGKSAFAGCGLTSLVVPLYVTKIGEKAFSGCSGLTAINTQAVTPPECGANAFANVDKSITLFVPEESVEDYKKAKEWKDFTNIVGVECALGSGTFGEKDKFTWKLTCNGALLINGSGEITYSSEIPWKDYASSVKSIVISNGVTVIGGSGGSIFGSLENLESLSLPNSLKVIKNNFDFCPKLATVSIPNSVTEIELSFNTCPGLETIIFGYGVKIIHESFEGSLSKHPEIICFAINPPGNLQNSFKDDTHYGATLYVPDASLSIYKSNIPWGEFSAVLPLSSRPDTHIIASGTAGNGITWELDSNGILTIKGKGDMSSWGIPAPASVGKHYIPADEPSAPWYPYHSDILYVVIEGGITSIGDNAFYGCTDIQSITCYATTPPTCGEGAFEGIEASGLLCVPEGSESAYQSADKWNIFTEVQPIEQLPASIDEVEAEWTNEEMRKCENEKILIGGQLFILRGDHLYDSTGKMVK